MTYKEDPGVVGTCVTALWTLLVTCPLFLYIVYSIVQSIPDKPLSLQIALWVFIPSHILGIIMATITKLVTDK